MAARNLYDYTGSGPFVLSRDGQDILTGTESDCWNYIHNHCASSVDWALKHEGYAMRQENPCPDCNGTGAVPALGVEENQDNGVVPCPTCKSEG